MSNKLQQAVEIFKILGWEGVTSENVLDLPLGTPEQKKIALAGLKSGDLRDVRSIDKITFSWVSNIDVLESELALFAVCLGVDARRAVNILPRKHWEANYLVISSRGKKYANDFINYACIAKRRPWEHNASFFGRVAVELVYRLELDVPENVEYIKDWVVYAATALDIKAATHGETDFPSLEMIERRFLEHIEVAFSIHTPFTGPLGDIVRVSVEQGIMTKEKAIKLCFSALNIAIRPGDRKVLIELLDILKTPDEQFIDQLQSLIPLLSLGESPITKKLAPILIKNTSSELLPEILMASLAVKANNTKVLVLKSALERDSPENIEDMADWIFLLTNDTDKSISKLALKIIDKWQLTTDMIIDNALEVQGLWKETPPVWNCPKFVINECTPEELTDMAIEIENRAAYVHDIIAEKFLAAIVIVAYKSKEEARISLRGIKTGSYINSWVNNKPLDYGSDTSKSMIKGFLDARDYAVISNLSKIPCILSSPSMEDLSINLADLVSRLNEYKKLGISVLEADLLLALTRLDLSTTSEKLEQQLSEINILVVLESGKKLKQKVSEIILGYLNDPFFEPIIDMTIHLINAKVSASFSKIKLPNSLSMFPERWRGSYSDIYSVFPTFGDIALGDIFNNYEVCPEQGLIMRQIARRKEALPKGGVINFFASQRSLTPSAANDVMVSVMEAWERGLLRPNVADVLDMDWNDKPPSNLSAFARVIEPFIEDGLLSVIWRILDDLILVSLKQARIIAGTGDLAMLILKYLPEVKLAVSKNLVKETKFDLPGIYQLSIKKGNSSAVSTAQKIMKELPLVSEKKEPPKGITVDDFNTVWIVNENLKKFIDDGVAISVFSCIDKSLMFELILPNEKDYVFQVLTIIHDGYFSSGVQCVAYKKPISDLGVEVHDNGIKVYLHFDKSTNAMVVGEHRIDFATKNNNNLSCKSTLLSSSLITVILGFVSRDDGNKMSYPINWLLRDAIDEGYINQVSIKHAVITLLKSPVVNIGKLIRPLEENKLILPVFWPILTESIKKASEIAISEHKVPKWTNRILDCAIRDAPYLKEAIDKGLIPKEDSIFDGLLELSKLNKKTTVQIKANELFALLNKK